MKPSRFRVFAVAVMAPLIIAVPAVPAAPAAASAPARSAGITRSTHQYLVDSAPVDTASAAFQSTVLSWMGNPKVSGSEAGSAARPLISALMAFQNRLEVQTAGARDDVRALATAFNALISDLRALSHDDIADTSSWEGPLLRQDVSTTAATNKVRHDLGLPPLSVSL
jgi:uncharacterized protein YkwD